MWRIGTQQVKHPWITDFLEKNLRAKPPLILIGVPRFWVKNPLELASGIDLATVWSPAVSKAAMPYRWLTVLTDHADFGFVD